jgi:hypothetical protein
MASKFPLRKRNSPPRKGDAVWDEVRIGTMNGHAQANGVITWVDYRGKEVMIKFHDGHRVIKSWDELEENWTDKLGGFYLLYVD